MPTAIRSLPVLACALALAAVPATAAAATPSDGPALTVRSVALRGHHTRVRGELPGAARRAVRVERLDGAEWVEVATTVADADGAFSISWVPDVLGAQELRAVPEGAPEATASATSDSATARTTVYRVYHATWYGPGLYGRRTACGVRLTPTTLGVAHRSLPCGTRVSILYRGHAIEVPVIDRGPYTDRASWDLTWAAASALGLLEAGRDRIGALRLDGPVQVATPDLGDTVAGGAVAAR